MELPSFCYVFDTFERFVLLSIHVKSEIFFEFKDLKYFENSVEPVDFESTDCELADTEVNTDIGVEIFVTSSSNKVDISSDVWQLGLVYLPHLPHQHLADQSEESISDYQPIRREYELISTNQKTVLPDWIKAVLALCGGEAAVQHGLVHGDLNLDILHCSSHGLLGSNCNNQSEVSSVQPIRGKYLPVISSLA